MRSNSGKQQETKSCVKVWAFRLSAKVQIWRTSLHLMKKFQGQAQRVQLIRMMIENSKSMSLRLVVVSLPLKPL